MKIACPSCGMHFEVDSDSLGRYFRCTECKTLFLGLNAKSVKEPHFVALDDADDAENAAAEEVQKIAAEDTDVAEDEAAPEIQPEEVEAEKEPFLKRSSITFESIRITPVQMFGAVAGFFALLLIVAVIAIWVAHSRVNTLQVTHARGDIRHVELQSSIDKLERDLEKAAAENALLKQQLADLNRKVEVIQMKVPLNSIGNTLNTVTANQETINQIAGEVAILKERLNGMEKTPVAPGRNSR